MNWRWTVDSGCSLAGSSSLRNSTSESNVHVHVDDGDAERRLKARPSACRTLSDGARKSRARRQLESEDSSYDSDYECSDSLTAPLYSSADKAEWHQQHDDVLRTVSDTLAAEFNEYVCVYNPSFQGFPSIGFQFIFYSFLFIFLLIFLFIFIHFVFIYYLLFINFY